MTFVQTIQLVDHLLSLLMGYNNNSKFYFDIESSVNQINSLTKSAQQSIITIQQARDAFEINIRSKICESSAISGPLAEMINELG